MSGPRIGEVTEAGKGRRFDRKTPGEGDGKTVVAMAGSRDADCSPHPRFDGWSKGRARADDPANAIES